MFRSVMNLCLLATTVACLAVPGGAQAGGIARVGQQAPDFTLDRHLGGSVTLSDHRGQVVMLMMIGYL